jgi:hypothetical protein
LTLQGLRREVRDYWKLVYAAQHHNVDIRYWVVLDPPLEMAGGGAPLHVVELSEPDPVREIPAKAVYLDPQFEVISRPRVDCYEKAPWGELKGCQRFRRGDSNSSGGVNLTDAIFILKYLFLGGQEPGCLDAADFDDTGDLDLTDAVLILNFLFRGVDLSEPPGPYECGNDPTRDDFPHCVDPSCS